MVYIILLPIVVDVDVEIDSIETIHEHLPTKVRPAKRCFDLVSARNVPRRVGVNPCASDSVSVGYGTEEFRAKMCRCCTKR